MGRMDWTAEATAVALGGSFIPQRRKNRNTETLANVISDLFSAILTVSLPFENRNYRACPGFPATVAGERVPQIPNYH